MSKFLSFKKILTIDAAQKYSVLSKKESNTLGEIKWFNQWRRYCFYPAPNTIFDSKCLADIEDFLDKLKK